MNESEVWFDQYVRQHGHETGEPEPALGGARNPDRLITWNGFEVLCEIKQFGAGVIPSGENAVRAIAAEDWFGPVRTQVHGASRQMREHHERGWPQVVVLANPDGQFIPLTVQDVVLALYGNPQVVMQIGVPPLWWTSAD